MNCTIVLPLCLSSLHCVCWSEDNIIAIAGGDEIAILTPRLRERGSNGTHWDTAIFKANEFTLNEVPAPTVLSNSFFSLGEEQSLRHVNALAWSPAGPARFGGCLLAVLSTNHVLSLWECRGLPNLDSSWKRVHTLNHTLEAYYSGQEDDDGAMQESDVQQSEALQVARRVRAFAWIPAIADSQNSTASLRMHDKAFTTMPHFLAVSTEDGDVLIVRVSSPYNILNPMPVRFETEVVLAIKARDYIHENRLNGIANGDLEGLLPGHNSIVERISCSDWLSEDASERSFASLACVANGRLFYVKLVMDTSAEDPQPNISQGQPDGPLSDPLLEISGALHFIPASPLLVVFTNKGACCIDTNVACPGLDKISFHNLDERWDEISGVTDTKDSNGRRLIHIASHLSTAAAKTSVLSLPLDVVSTYVQPLWHKQILASRTSFSEQHDLAGRVAERVWGLASSPLGDYIVTASSMLASDSVTYAIPSEQRAIINIAQEPSWAEEQIVGNGFHATHAVRSTVEAGLFSLQRISERSKAVVQVPSTEETELIQPNKSELNGDAIAGVSLPSSSDVSSVIRYLRQQVYGSPALQNTRTKYLVDFALKKMYAPDQVFQPVLVQLLHAITALHAVDTSSDKLSETIRRNFTTIGSKLHPETNYTTLAQPAEEKCHICGETIIFESVKWARCRSGHQFSRCSLTFVAIQEPGTTKRCAICGSQFLNEWRMPEMMTARGMDETNEATGIRDDHGDGEDAPMAGHESKISRDMPQIYGTSKSPAVSLARIIFAAFDRCIYCGGKFIA